MPLPMPIERAVTVMRGAVAAGCPKCKAHGRSVVCGSRLSPQELRDHRRHQAQIKARKALGEK